MSERDTGATCDHLPSSTPTSTNQQLSPLSTPSFESHCLQLPSSQSSATACSWKTTNTISHIADVSEYQLILYSDPAPDTERSPPDIKTLEAADQSTRSISSTPALCSENIMSAYVDTPEREQWVTHFYEYLSEQNSSPSNKKSDKPCGADGTEQGRGRRERRKNRQNAESRSRSRPGEANGDRSETMDQPGGASTEEGEITQTTLKEDQEQPPLAPLENLSLSPTSPAAANEAEEAGPHTIKSEDVNLPDLAWISSDSNEANQICEDIGAVCRRGRYHDNEDRVFVIEDLNVLLNATRDDGFQLAEPVMLVVICDGHGGDAAPIFIQKYLVERVLQSTYLPELATSISSETLESILREVVAEAEEEFSLWARSKRNYSGACLVMALVTKHTITTANVGDCRAVLFCPNQYSALRRATSSGILQLTSDHTPRSNTERDRIRRAGGIIIDNRVNGSLEPSRTIGDIEFKDINGTKAVIAVPDIETFTAGPDKCLVLASDGLWDFVSNLRVGTEITRRKKQPGVDAMSITEFLADLAVGMGSGDDISIVILYF